MAAVEMLADKDRSGSGKSASLRFLDSGRLFRIYRRQCWVDVKEAVLRWNRPYSEICHDDRRELDE